MKWYDWLTGWVAAVRKWLEKYGIQKHCQNHYYSTIKVERFAGLNIRSFALWSFSREYFHSPLASSVYYLTIAKYSRGETFVLLLKNVKAVKG